MTESRTGSPDIGDAGAAVAADSAVSGIDAECTVGSVVVEGSGTVDGDDISDDDGGDTRNGPFHLNVAVAADEIDHGLTALASEAVSP